ncbi:hypothetical protein Pint_25150 [Pistacia integerrima]|uniref:Uncharacterized protein n=1 Tax=Pistacia integerrima TaxID=434235 RepID=A0ACC0YID3_9ROSI|nr:hypothetical protein Pint_25150 [Pistacia integerrima]
MKSIPPEEERNMYTLKEKVTEKLSRLFADSPHHHSPLQDPQVRSYSKEGKSFTSYFSFIVPLASSDRSKSEKQRRDLKTVHSLPVRRIIEDFDQQNEQLDEYEECITSSPVRENKENCPVNENKQGNPVNENKQPVSLDNEYKDCASGSNSGDSDVFAEANDISIPTKLLSNLSDDSSFITPELYEFLQSSLPNIAKGCQWILLYSTLKHGISLRTLIRKSADLSGPCLLIVGDMKGAVFGGMLECPLKPTPKRKYQGTNQSFVFTTIYGQPRLFRPTGTLRTSSGTHLLVDTSANVDLIIQCIAFWKGVRIRNGSQGSYSNIGANRYYYMCMNEFLALGGGGNFALCLDGDL